MKSNKIHTVCLDCGRKHDKKNKVSFGMWMGTCDMCEAKDVSCAAAGHDFGIYNNEEEEANDFVQDKI